MIKEFHISTPDRTAAKHLTATLKCHPVLADILVNRGITTPEDADEFFTSDLASLRSPMMIQDMDKAVGRILKALQKEEKILIFGDYDVDGITAVTLLLEFFQGIGAQVSYYIPHREKEGYGLAPEHIHRIARRKVSLIITVDCGSSSGEAIRDAKKAGIDVIVTDHHHIQAPFPAAVAVVNPNRPDCTAGFGMLAGVGVAFALLICLRKYLREQNFWAGRPEPNLKSLCDLVALGTVADIVPLRKENRIFTKTGMAALHAATRPGIRALRQAAGLSSQVSSADDIAFRLAPRLNAAGRIAHAVCAVRLLTTKDDQKARRIAQLLNRLNDRRRSTEQDILTQILAHLEATPAVLQRNSLVLAYPDWHEGVLGIVAAKLVERFFRPVVLLSIRNGIGKGSARSIPGFHIFEGLAGTRTHLERFGGHAMAAGLRLEEKRIDDFRQAFEAVVAGNTTPEDFIPRITIDRELSFDEITPALASALESLHPFGAGNPEPVFISRNVSVLFSKIVGHHHCQLRLQQTGSPAILNAIQFNVDPDAPRTKHLDRIAYRLRWNHWHGGKSIQLMVEAMWSNAPPAGGLR